MAVRKKKKQSTGRSIPTGELANALRLAARTEFVCNRRQMSFEQLCELPQFCGVQRNTLRRWATEDDWEGARIKELAAWRRLIEGQASSALMRMRKRQLDDLNFMHQQAMDVMDDDLVESPDWKSAASVALKAQALATELSRSLAGEFADQAMQAGMNNPEPSTTGLPEAQASDEALDKMTQEEALFAAHAVMRRRKEAKLLEQQEKEAAQQAALAVPNDPNHSTGS